MADLADGPEGVEQAMAGIRDAPDGGAALAAAHLADLDGLAVSALGDTANRVAFTLCLAAADEAQAAARSILIDPVDLEPCAALAGPPRRPGRQRDPHAR